MHFFRHDVVQLQDGSFWLVTDKGSQDDLSVGEQVLFIEDSEYTNNIGLLSVNSHETRVFPAWQVVRVVDDF